MLFFVDFSSCRVGKLQKNLYIRVNERTNAITRNQNQETVNVYECEVIQDETCSTQQESAATVITFF